MAKFLSFREESTAAYWIVGWASVVVGIAALGLYVGHELHERYKFRQRTQYDLFSHAGDSMASAEYGVGI